MDGGEKWRLPRGGGGVQDKMVINGAMLRFRPIAPKPVIGNSGSGDSVVDNKNLLLSSKRSKRKYVRVRKNNNGYRRKKRLSSSRNQETDQRDPGGSKDVNKVVTLQLLPEKNDLQVSPTRGSWCNNLDRAVTIKQVHQEDDQDQDMLLHLKNPMVGVDGEMEKSPVTATDQTVVMVPQRRTVLETRVTVESVTDTCMGADARVLGSTDMEIVNNLVVDTCPGFVSDGLNRVQWVNGAYKRMVTMTVSREEDDKQLYSSPPSSSMLPPEIIVRLVIKERLPYMWNAFTCRVKLQYTWQKEKYSKMVPCDVWRMDCGGFAWRLDVEAALSLGR